MTVSEVLTSLEVATAKAYLPFHVEDEAEDWVDRLRPDLPEYAQQIQDRLDGARAAVERAAWKTICASSDPIGEWSTGYKPERTPEQDEDLQACIDDIENLEGYR